MPEWKAALTARLASLRLSPAREREILDELSQHLDDVYRERRTAGESHEDAMRSAVDEIDERDLLAREMRPLVQARYTPPTVPGRRGRGWFADVLQDVAYAARTLAHARGWTVVIILLLALGIGANTALFSATNALLFTSIPVQDPSSLVRLRWTGKNDAATDHAEYGYRRPMPDGGQVGSTFPYAGYRDLASSASDLVDLVACAPFSQVTAVVNGAADLASGFAASGNFFRVMGVDAGVGRVFSEQDDVPGAAPVAVISSRYWQARFGGDPSIVGRVIRVNDVPLTVVGVTRPEYTGVQQTLDEPPDISFPLSLDAQIKASTGRADYSQLTRPTAWWLQVIGRLREGATAAQVQGKLEGVFRQDARSALDGYLESLSAEDRASVDMGTRNAVPRLLVEPGGRGIYDVRPDALTSARILNAVVIVILLIICANVANLMLSRAAGRRKEIAVRLSLGATRGRLVRQLFTEAVLLAALGAVCGVAVAYYGVQLLPPPASRADVFDGRTLAFAAVAAVLTSIFFGALPALRATDVDVNAGLKESSRGIAGGRNVLARGLLVVQVALSLVLLVGAGLFLQTLKELRRVDVGFDSNNLLLVRVAPRLGGYDLERSTELYGRLIERVGSVPGVMAVSLSQLAPLSGGYNSTEIHVAGRATEDREIYRMVVSPGFFDVLGIPLLRGRDLTGQDVRSAPRVAVINEAAARKFFGNDDPVGKRFGSSPDRLSEVEVVGVVKDAKYASVREAAPPTMYQSLQQSPRPAAVLEVRTVGAPLGAVASVREAIRQVDPNLPIAEVSTQAQNIEQLFARERLFAHAYALFGGIALLLASIGLFGLMSYNVARRTSEMGIRMALGAQRQDVLGLVMRESLLLVVLGIAFGGALAVVSVRFVASMLFSVPPYDVGTFAAAVLVMVAVSAVAAYLPARRASRVDPIVALRYE